MQYLHAKMQIYYTCLTNSFHSFQPRHKLFGEQRVRYGLLEINKPVYQINNLKLIHDMPNITCFAYHTGSFVYPELLVICPSKLSSSRWRLRASRDELVKNVNNYWNDSKSNNFKAAKWSLWVFIKQAHIISLSWWILMRSYTTRFFTNFYD